MKRNDFTQREIKSINQS